MEEIKDPTHKKGEIRHIKLSPPPPPATRPTNDISQKKAVLAYEYVFEIRSVFKKWIKTEIKHTTFILNYTQNPKSVKKFL